MGIFTRFKDIISSNINSMLDHAEDPEKMIKLMIREMEETLVELKASCAGYMADCKRIGGELSELGEKVELWEHRARLAVEKERDDLAREALLEKKRWTKRYEAVERELAGFNGLVTQCQDDIAKLEDKLNGAVEKQRLLIQRHIRANSRMKAQSDIRKAEGGDAVRRFEQMEQRIERMEAEADLVNPRDGGLENEFQLLEGDGELEKELEELKKASGPKGKDEKKKAEPGNK